MNKYTHSILLVLALITANTLVSTTTIAALHTSVPAQQKSQVAGFHRQMLGEFEITALYDGYTRIDNKLLKGISAEDADKLLKKMFVNSENGVQTAVNGYLVNTGSNLILVDAGAAICFGPTLGNLKENMIAAGYQPEQIDAVLLTHLHADHACGISDNGKVAFPNATVYAPAAEAEYWLNPENTANVAIGAQRVFKLAQDAVAPYLAAKKFKTYQPEETLFPGVKIVPTPGHTPGHTSYLFTSGEQQLLIWGDIVHSHAIQFSQPEVALDFDVDARQAIETRKTLFENVVQNNLWIAGAHLPFLGIGHVSKEEKTYRWVPIEYAPIVTSVKK